MAAMCPGDNGRLIEEGLSTTKSEDRRCGARSDGGDDDDDCLAWPA